MGGAVDDDRDDRALPQSEEPRRFDYVLFGCGVSLAAPFPFWVSEGNVLMAVTSALVGGHFLIAPVYRYRALSKDVDRELPQS